MGVTPEFDCNEFDFYNGKKLRRLDGIKINSFILLMIMIFHQLLTVSPYLYGGQALNMTAQK
jgi:hypothetical protein